MPWEEFKQFLSGISPETPLGRIVSIRSEKDKGILKHFTPEQRRIRSEWQNRIAKNKAPADTEKGLEAWKNAFIAMAGGETGTCRHKA